MLDKLTALGGDNMRINNNMSAVITNNQLLGTEGSLADVMEKLSSGFSINHASDNPSGIAIAGKMQAQIEGLAQASTNGSDGISVLQTAEGALNEVTDMIQRMRELSVQAANGTNSDYERETIQKELDSLLEEIDRIADTTEFNNINLLNGSLDNRTYAEHATRIQTTKAVPAGVYQLTITKASKRAEVSTTGPWPETLPMSGTISLNGRGIELHEGMSRVAVYEAMRDVCEKGAAVLSNPSETEPMTISSYKYGAKADLKIDFSSMEFAQALGFDATEVESGATIHLVGEDAEINLNKDPAVSMFGPQATYRVDGNHIIVSDTKGFEMSFLAEAGYQADATGTPPVDGIINFNVTDIGSMTLHVGANKGQNMEVRIASVTTEFMYIDDLSVTRVRGPEDALDSLTEALNYVTGVRSQLGAYENRLEHTTKSLDTTEENMTSAISRIEDADMATTMVEYTKLNVLEQAGTSALAQANELPQLALQLLQ
jgi:flagellin